MIGVVDLWPIGGKCAIMCQNPSGIHLELATSATFRRHSGGYSCRKRLNSIARRTVQRSSTNQVLGYAPCHLALALILRLGSVC